ncbi:MAG: glycosyltransferase family 4 protein [Ktedonobacteraceae bacterium]
MNKTDNRPQIAYLTSDPAHNRRSFSGSTYYIGKALERHCGEVTYLEYIMSWERRVLGRIVREAAKHHFKWHIAYKRLPIVAKKQAKIAAQRLAGHRFDVIVALDCAPEIAFLQTDIPILLIVDITFHLQQDYSAEYSNLLAFSVRQGEIIEQAAFQNTSKLLFESSWAARSAIEDYGIAAQKIHVIAAGANLDHIPPREQVLAKKPSKQCRLLFVGVDWQRKGGDIAYETLLKLHEMGIEAELTVCGCVPPTNITHPHLTVIPFLDKNDERQVHEIEKLYIMSDFLVLPTRVEAFGVVFCEAGAFGLPVITTHTGGVPEVVKDSENGFLLPLDARGAEYAEVIAKIYRDEQRYAQMVRSGRAAFDERLNWDVWGMAVKDILNEMLAAKKHS